MFSIKLNGRWLRQIAGYSPPTVEFGLHGLEAASWEMSPTFRHPTLRAGVAVQIYDGGAPHAFGYLLEPGSDGQISAVGLWREAETTPCLDQFGALTRNPFQAVYGARARGDVRWGQQATSGLVDADWSTDVSTDMSLADLLDSWAAGAGLRCSINGNGEFEAKVDPTVPQWHVPHSVAGRGLTPAEDEFYTHVTGTYLSSPGVFGSRTIGSTEAAVVFRRRTLDVGDHLINKGVISAATADAELSGIFLKVGARMGWAEGLELSRGEIVNGGGIPAPLNQVRAGQMIRLRGTVDVSRANRIAAFADVLIASSKYTDGSAEISLAPYGYAPRNFAGVLEEAVS